MVYYKNIWKYIIISTEERKKYYLFVVIHNKKTISFKEMKTKITLIGIICTLVIFIIIMFKQNSIISQDRDLYKRNMNSALIECVEWKTKDSLSAAKNATLNLKISELERYRNDDINQINQLKKKNEELNNLIKNSSKTEIKIITQLKDTVIYKDTVKYFNWNDNWTSVKGLIQKDTVDLNINNSDSLVISVATKYKRFLGFLWKTKKIKDQNVYVVSKNPHTTITNIEYYGVSK